MVVGAVLAAFAAGECLRLFTGTGRSLFDRVFGLMVRPEETERLTGATYLLASSWLTIFLFPQAVAIICLLFLTVSDAVAALVGKSIGKMRIYGKTVEGSAAFFSVSAIMTALFYDHLAAGLLGALTATLAELLPSRINDNVSIPLLSGCVLFLLI